MKRTTSVIYQICYNIYIPVCIKIKLHIFHNYSDKFCNLHQGITRLCSHKFTKLENTRMLITSLWNQLSPTSFITITHKHIMVLITKILLITFRTQPIFSIYVIMSADFYWKLMVTYTFYILISRSSGHLDSSCPDLMSSARFEVT